MPDTGEPPDMGGPPDMADEPNPDAPDDDATSPPDAPTPDPALVEDEPDHAAEAEKWKALARKHEKQSKLTQKELDTLKDATASDADKALAAARSEGAAEIRTAFAGRLFAAELKSAASGKVKLPARVLSDPEMARRMLDLDEFPVADDGSVDSAAITTALEALLESDPSLAVAPDAPPPPTSVPGGPRNPSTGARQLTESEVKAMKPAEVQEARKSGQLDTLLGIRR